MIFNSEPLLFSDGDFLVRESLVKPISSHELELRARIIEERQALLSVFSWAYVSVVSGIFGFFVLRQRRVYHFTEFGLDIKSKIDRYLD